MNSGRHSEIIFQMKENFEFTEAFVDKPKVPVLVIMTLKPENKYTMQKIIFL